MRDLIRGVASPLRGRTRRLRGHGHLALELLRGDERGVVAIIVGLLMGAVLLGMGALVIDVGQLYQERAQLQNGADAAALAVAKSCILSTCTPASALTTAQTYANANHGGGVAGVGVVCGSGGTLTACGASTGLITDCPSPPASGTNYVDVHTSTKTSGGSTLVAPVFAKELLGNGSYTGTTVLACAQVEWGSGGSTYSGILTAFTTPACQWDKAVSSGIVYGTPPPSLPPSSYDRQLLLGYFNRTGCSTEPAGSDGPGTFGWITETGGCTLNSIIGTTYPVRTGTASPNCNTPLFDDAQNKSLIYIPVYTSATGNGAGSVYNLKGIAAFVVTGYNVPGGSFTWYPDWLNSANTCFGTTYCIDGYFVSEPGTLSSSGGVTSMKLTG